MRFIWDTDKALSNEEKHSVSFQEAAEILQTECFRVPVSSKGERRILAIGKVHGEYLSVIYTERNGALRIISARHSSKKERIAYERDHNRRIR
ncbi:BrnT family toxin [Paratractidigestivibacter sp.]|uniref:BrnT family toxin n=1 Tax=Paratractidigestivibacter sp. TaxID=2847316 RepID=UPI0039F53A56